MKNYDLQVVLDHARQHGYEPTEVRWGGAHGWFPHFLHRGNGAWYYLGGFPPYKFTPLKSTNPKNMLEGLSWCGRLLTPCQATSRPTTRQATSCARVSWA